MLREEQAKSRPPEAPPPPAEMKKSPSIQSEVRKERSESEEDGGAEGLKLSGLKSQVCLHGGNKTLRSDPE